MSSKKKAPPIQDELVEWLRSLFDTRVSRQPMPHEKYIFMSGQESVISRIEEAAKRQRNNILEM